ncbi:MAG TPA: CNNM domain-containing protein, partial [Pyrinomonadaceae bacterium]|nr:CNNM domain-containing protein [Pyrinomonadaceae bacterium]
MDPDSTFPLFLQAAEHAASISIAQASFEISLMMLIVLVNAYFVAAEFSLVSVRKTRLETKASEGSKGAQA